MSMCSTQRLPQLPMLGRWPGAMIQQAGDVELSRYGSGISSGTRAHAEVDAAIAFESECAVPAAVLRR